MNLGEDFYFSTNRSILKKIKRGKESQKRNQFLIEEYRMNNIVSLNISFYHFSTLSNKLTKINN